MVMVGARGLRPSVGGMGAFLAEGSDLPSAIARYSSEDDVEKVAGHGGRAGYG
jgi:hypothetical protein